MVGSTEVRLFGIDAPEFDQSCTRNGQSWSCGSAAADQLMRLVTGKDVRCTSMGIDQHGRTLGRCMVGTTDINRMMVATGSG
jgi:endonuclease YncB( thermonuclease family)